MSRTWTIALHFNIGYEVALRILDGVIQYAQEHPELVLREFNFSKEEPGFPESPPWLRKADGVLMNLRREPGIHDWLRRGGVPAVNTGGDLCKEKQVVSVFTDPQSVAGLAVRHFLDLGRRHFAFVGDREADATERIHKAMTKELIAHGLSLHTYRTEKVYMGTFDDFSSLAEVEPGLVDLIREAPKPLALLAQTDRCAAAICRVIQFMGLAIPDDVAVVGIHDTAMARLSSPPISSIRPPHQAIGYRAARVLHRILLGQRPGRRNILIPAMKLVGRSSSIEKPRAATTDVDRALDFIREHATEGIQVPDVAAHVHVPLRTFQIEFAASVGRPVGEEIRRVRLERIKNLLEMTDLPLENVARLAGLATAVSLIRIVNSATGMSPADYRRQHRDEA